MNYKVGQVLYMTNPKSLKIIPIQIVEEVTRTTMSGIEKTYMIQFPDSKKTVADISSLKGELFSDIKLLRATMLEKATASIDNMINMATHLAQEEYSIEKNNDQNKNDVQVEANNDIIMVDLGNGTKAKMNTSSLEKVANQ